MASKGSKDDAYEVSDSTDWLKTPLVSLAATDAALRCQVCKDFYQTPMITSCSHTFCSLCIRRCLGNDGRCPACRTQDQETKLKHNWALEEVVEAFKEVRPEVLAYARSSIAAVSDSASPKRKFKDLQVGEGHDGQPSKRTRSSGRTAATADPTIVIDVDDGDDDYIPEDGLVTCPICNERMKLLSINAHIDNCDSTTKEAKSKTNRGSQPGPGSIGSNPAGRLERLPHLNYSMFKENALRKKLGDIGISTTGTRQLLERRHTEWITLWNANCDSKSPRKKSELKQELEMWERTQGGRAPSSNGALNSGSQLLNKDFDGAAWSSKHDSSFQQLIANARRKTSVRVSTATERHAAPLNPPNMSEKETEDHIAQFPGGTQNNVTPISAFRREQGGRSSQIETPMTILEDSRDAVSDSDTTTVIPG